mgnify:CR=1 FL=1
MSKLNDRENAFEKKYAHDEQMNCKIEARCSKLFWLRIAEMLGLTGPAASEYAGEVVGANIEEPGFKDVIRKVRADLNAKNIEISDHMLQVELEQALTEAKRQILAEGN